MIAVAPNDVLLEKLKSNLQEVRARGGELYVFADADSEMTASRMACMSCNCPVLRPAFGLAARRALAVAGLPRCAGASHGR